MKKVILTLSLFTIGFGGYTQQDFQFTQYMSSLSAINPAYVGSNDFGTVSGITRKQWVRFDGAPSTGLLTYETPFSKYNMGIGGVFSYDKIGVSEQINISANYAYHLKLGSGKLSFGLNAGILHYRAKLSELTVWDEQDVVFGNNYSGKIIPEFGFGSYFYGENYYAGISVSRLTNVNTDKPINLTLNTSPSLNRHYYLMGGYDFTIDENIVLKSFALVKYVDAAPVQAEVSVLAEYQKQYLLGVSFRTKDCIAPIVQFQFKDIGKIGYAYDITLSKMSGYSSGSHEIMLSYFIKGKPAAQSSFKSE